MIQFVINIITHPAFNFASALFGFLVGNYFAISRDRRNDFNKAADILAEVLIKERRGPHPMTNIDFSAFKRVLTKKEDDHLERCIEEYNQSKRNAKIIYAENSTDLTHPSCCWFQDVNPIVLSIDKLLDCTRRK